MPSRRACVVAVLITAAAAVGCRPGSVPPQPVEPIDGSLGRRAAHTATALADGGVLVVGGCVEDGCTVATNSAALLTPDGSRPVAPLDTARDAHTGTLLEDGRVLVVGGFEGEGRPALGEAEIFDPRTDRWTTTGSLRVGRGGHAAARLGDGRVLVAGGWAGPRTYVSSTEIFDPRTGRFSAGPELSSALDSLTATSLPDGRVLVAGGRRSDGTAAATTVLIGPDGSAAAGSPGLRTGRFKHAAVGLPSGRVLLLGGTQDDRALLTSTEVFDPVTERFGPGPELLGGRYKLSDAAVALPDGRVVIAGSGPGVEVVDLGAGDSAVVPDLADVTASFSTVSLVGDEVWVLGGYDSRIRLTNTDRRVPVSTL